MRVARSAWQLALCSCTRDTLEFAIENNLEGFCLNLDLSDFQDGVQAVNTGCFAFALGAFVDYSPKCK